jgi:hypothetical protein
MGVKRSFAPYLLPLWRANIRKTVAGSVQMIVQRKYSEQTGVAHVE